MQLEEVEGGIVVPFFLAYWTFNRQREEYVSLVPLQTVLSFEVVKLAINWKGNY